MTKEIDYNTIEIDGVNTKDYPDFCDAYVSYAEYNDGTELNEIDLEELSENRDLVMDKTYEKLF